MEETKQERRRNFALLLAAAVGLLAIIAYGLYSLSGGGSSGKPKPPKISLLPNTPPPPPPPKEEKKPEPPKEQKEVKMEQPDVKQPPAPENTLKMEGEKGDSPSAFQAGTVTKENYIPGSERGNPFAFYSNLMQKFLQEELARNKALAGKEYRISVMLWLDNSGKIEKFSLTQTSGNSQTDTLLRNALAEMPPLKAPPENMPRPVGVRISSRG
jgi:protein TonB